METTGARFLKDSRNLLDLFQQVVGVSEYTKNEEFWEQCVKQAKKELQKNLKAQTAKTKKIAAEQEAEAAEMAGLGATCSSRAATEAKQIEVPEPPDWEITLRAEQTYRSKDSQYNQAVLKRTEAINKIPQRLYAIQDSLLKYDVAKGTLLQVNCRKITELLWDEGLVYEAKKALELIIAKSKSPRDQKQEPITKKPAKIKVKGDGAESKSSLDLTSQQTSIIKAIGEESIDGRAVAYKLKRKLGGSIKQDLAYLRRMKVVANDGDGYYVMPDYRYVLKKAK